MNKITKCITLIFLLNPFAWYNLSYAQKTYDDKSKKTIAINADNLIKSFGEIFKFEYKLEINGTDSLSMIKRDSTLRSQKIQQYDKMIEFFKNNVKNQNDFAIPNFIFGNQIIYREKGVETVPDFLSYDDFSRLYSDVFLSSYFNDPQITYFISSDDDIPKFEVENYYKELNIEENQITVLFRLNYSGFIADTVSLDTAFVNKLESIRNVEGDFAPNLYAQIGWKNLNDQKSYFIKSISQKYKSTLESTLLNSIVIPFNEWTEKIELGKINKVYNEDFFQFFGNHKSKCIECSLFFNQFSKCLIPENKFLSPEEYLKCFDDTISDIQNFKINTEHLRIAIFERYSDRLILKYKPKWNYSFQFTDGDQFSDAPIEDTIAFYVELKYKKNLIPFKPYNKSKFESVKILQISYDGSPFEIQYPLKGYFALEPYVTLSSTSLPVHSNSEFGRYESEKLRFNKMNLGVGAEASYFWKKSKINKINFGLGIGLAYSQYSEVLSLSPVNDSILDIENDVGVHTLLVSGNSITQELHFNCFEFSPEIHMKYQNNSNSFFQVTFGASIGFPGLNAKVESGGDSLSYKGRYFIEYPNQTSYSYLLENMQEYGFLNYASGFKEGEEKLDFNPSILFQIKPSYGIKLNPKTNNYFKIGAFIKIGKSPIKKRESQSPLFYSELEQRGTIGNAFTNGSSGIMINYGISLSVQFFSSRSVKNKKGL